MADRYLERVVDGIAQAEVVQAALAASVVRLFDQTIVPDVNTTTADLIAAETALVGYPAGGYPVAAMLGPMDAIDGNGVMITTPLLTVLYASGAAASIGGAWIEEVGNATLRTLIFDPPRTLAALPDGFQFVFSIPFGRN